MFRRGRRNRRNYYFWDDFYFDYPLWDPYYGAPRRDYASMGDGCLLFVVIAAVCAAVSAVLRILPYVICAVLVFLAWRQTKRENRNLFRFAWLSLFYCSSAVALNYLVVLLHGLFHGNVALSTESTFAGVLCGAIVGIMSLYEEKIPPRCWSNE
jgi:hypothetical protein